MVDIGTLSLILLVSMFVLLAIGMPLGFASAILAVEVLVLRFGFDTLFSRPGSGPLNVLAQRMYGLTTDYVLISVPLFILMASLLERSGIARAMYSSLSVWLNRTRGGIAIVTSIMAIIMAAMSGIIGGEVVLLGLIALPQMLRLGYNQDLAIGTICASGSLGTMIPPSIVLIIYGLVTETSIKALFTGAFIPGFMLASFFIVYIVIRTQLRPQDAPLPEPTEEDDNLPDNGGLLIRIVAAAAVAFALVELIFGTGILDPGLVGGALPLLDAGVAGHVVLLIAALVFLLMSVLPKGRLFSSFLMITAVGLFAIGLARVVFFTLTGQNVAAEGVDPIAFGQPHHIQTIGIMLAVTLALLFLLYSSAQRTAAWQMGKGLIAPIFVVGVVLGSIYGGITGITEAAGMGVVAVLLVAAFRRELNFALIRESLMRTWKSTGTILWVTFGATALAGAYTIAGGPTYVANLIIGAEMPTMSIILVMMVIFLILGALMDWVGIVLLVMPVFLPIVTRLPVEELGVIGTMPASMVPIWFGVLFCMNMQVSFLSPPFGPAAFYLKSVAPPHISLTDIFRGFLPFIAIQLLALSVLIVWPGITLLLL